MSSGPRVSYFGASALKRMRPGFVSHTGRGGWGVGVCLGSDRALCAQ